MFHQLIIITEEIRLDTVPHPGYTSYELITEAAREWGIRRAWVLSSLIAISKTHRLWCDLLGPETDLDKLRFLILLVHSRQL